MTQSFDQKAKAEMLAALMNGEQPASIPKIEPKLKMRVAKARANYQASGPVATIPITEKTPEKAMRETQDYSAPDITSPALPSNSKPHSLIKKTTSSKKQKDEEAIRISQNAALISEQEKQLQK